MSLSPESAEVKIATEFKWNEIIDFFVAVHKGDNATIINYLDKGMKIDEEVTEHMLHTLHDSTQKYHAFTGTGFTMGTTAIHIAAAEGHLETVKLLVVRGAHINASIPNKGLAPLHLAAFYRHVQVVEFLITKGANVNLSSKENVSHWLFLSYSHGTALHYAIGGWQKTLEQYKNDEMLNLKEVSREDKQVVKKNFKDAFRIVQLLLANKADINAVNYYGESVLHLCASTENPFEIRFVEFFILKGANLDLQTTRDNRIISQCVKSTPLLYATHTSKRFPGLQLLLDAGASPLIKDSWGDNFVTRKASGRGWLGNSKYLFDREHMLKINEILMSRKIEKEILLLAKNVEEEYCKLTRSESLKIADPLLIFLIKQTANKLAPSMVEDSIKELTEHFEKLETFHQNVREVALPFFRNSLRNRLTLHFKKRFLDINDSSLELSTSSKEIKIRRDFNLATVKEELLQSAKLGRLKITMSPCLQEILSMNILDLPSKQVFLFHLIQANLARKIDTQTKLKELREDIDFLKQLELDFKFYPTLAKKRDKSLFVLSLENNATIEMIKFIIDENLIDINEKCSYTFVKGVLTYNSNKNSVCNISILSLAIQKKREDVVNLLCDKGALIQAEKYNIENSPLMVALKVSASKEIFKALFNKGADFYDTDKGYSLFAFFKDSPADQFNILRMLFEDYPTKLNIAQLLELRNGNVTFLLDIFYLQLGNEDSKALLWNHIQNELSARYQALNKQFSKPLVNLIFEYTGSEFISENHQFKFRQPSLPSRCAEFSLYESNQNRIHWMYKKLADPTQTTTNSASAVPTQMHSSNSVQPQKQLLLTTKKSIPRMMFLPCPIL